MLRMASIGNHLWVHGSKIMQSVIGIDWVIELEGELIEEASHVVDFQRNLFGFKKPYKRLKYTPGSIFYQDDELHYADENGNLRVITTKTKPTVRVSKKRITPLVI